jgi:hypothetical protein
MNQIDSSLHYTLESVRADSTRWSGYLGLATFYFVKGDTANAKESFQKAIVLEPRLRKGVVAFEEFEREGHYFTEREKDVFKQMFSLFK